MSNLLKKPVEIAPGVWDITWYRRWGRRYRSYLFEGDVPTLVDTCYEGEEFASELFEGIERVGVRPERLIITHGDGDHMGSLEAVVEEYGLEAWVPAETEGVPEDLPNLNRYSDGDVIGPFTAVHVPGHEPDNYVLVDEEASIAVLGDAAVGSDVRGLPPGYLVVHGESVTHDVREAERNLSRLIDYDFEIGLVFHGSSAMEGASEKIERYVDGPKKNR